MTDDSRHAAIARQTVALIALVLSASCTSQPPPCIDTIAFQGQAEDVRYHLEALRDALPSLPASADRAEEEARLVVVALRSLGGTTADAAPGASRQFGDAAYAFARESPSRRASFITALGDVVTALDAASAAVGQVASCGTGNDFG